MIPVAVEAANTSLAGWDRSLPLIVAGHTLPDHHIPCLVNPRRWRRLVGHQEPVRQGQALILGKLTSLLQKLINRSHADSLPANPPLSCRISGSGTSFRSS